MMQLGLWAVKECKREFMLSGLFFPNRFFYLKPERKMFGLHSIIPLTIISLCQYFTLIIPISPVLM